MLAEFLVTSVTIHHVVSRDAWQDSPAVTTIFTKGRYEESTRLSVTAGGEEKYSGDMLYLGPDDVDSVSAEDEIVIVGIDEPLTARKVSKMRDKSGILRHIEVML